jgi:hypothetical protein
MSQLYLFHPDCPEPVKRPPDLGYIRKSLARLLRIVKDAEIMPWSEAETESRAREFPQLAALLPTDEAVVLVSEFAQEIKRLRCSR